MADVDMTDAATSGDNAGPGDKGGVAAGSDGGKTKSKSSGKSKGKSGSAKSKKSKSSKASTGGDDDDSDDGPSGSVAFPLSRVKKIMKCDPEVKNVSADATYAVAAATEAFLIHLAQAAQDTMHADPSRRKTVKYDDIATAVRTHDELEFLDDVVPRRVPGYEVPAAVAQSVAHQATTKITDKTFFDADEAGDEEAAMESAARRLKHRGYVSSLVRERDVDSTATTAAGDDDDGDAADAEAPGEEN